MSGNPAGHDDGASPTNDAVKGEHQARVLLARIDAGGAPPDALAHALIALLAGYGREIPMSHHLLGFARLVQQRIAACPGIEPGKHNAPAKGRIEGSIG